jgi:diguanylate cyclase (GGDEF)-like protein
MFDSETGSKKDPNAETGEKMNDQFRIENIKSDIISLLGKNGVETASAAPPYDPDSTKNGCDVSFSGLLKELVHSDFSEDEAQIHWKNILDNYSRMKGSLDRDVGIRIAAYDYFLNHEDMFKQTLLVEHGFVRRLRHSALIDPVTGAFSRSYFEQHIKKELKRAVRHNRQFSLLLLDLDHLNMLNKSRGQEFSDSILIRTVKILRESCREEDLLCRFGPEELIFFLPETNAEGAYHFAERILYRIKEDKLFIENGLNVSGGISEYPNDSRNIFHLIKCADSALYHAKAKGKDKISFYRERNELSSIYDGLTGLFNHSHFESLLGKEHARAVRHTLKYSVLYLDIDQFNEVNIDEGDVFGDLALTQFACLLSNRCRELDMLARIGGGQFAFILPETDGAAACIFAERLRESILDKCSFNQRRFTFSCGIASYPFDGFDARDIEDFARSACEQAKKEGGNRIAHCKHNRRVGKRYKKNISLKYKLLETSFTDLKQFDLVTEDISVHGMRCRTAEEIPIRTRIILHFKHKGLNTTHLIVLAKVVWEKEESKGSHVYGLEFEETDEGKLEQLAVLINTDDE